ncbi:MAG: hypothetical protein AAB073_00720, partial [Pseudomonadota bacterium]
MMLLRNRALALRAQAYFGLLLILLISGYLIFFLSTRSYPEQIIEENASPQSRRPPFSYRTFEERHKNLPDKLDDLIKATEQKTIYLFDNQKKTPEQIIKTYEIAINDL